MILADTSVWIDHFRRGSASFARRLEAGEVATPIVVLGELATGNLLNRRETLAALRKLPRVKHGTSDECFAYLEAHRLYTGSAGWMYRAGLESILGFRLRGTTLVIDPCIPKSWPGFEIEFRYRSAHYSIAVKNPRSVSRGVSSTYLDGQALQGGDSQISLSDDGASHKVEIVLG
jgi:hypothetical protein